VASQRFRIDWPFEPARRAVSLIIDQIVHGQTSVALSYRGD
jgi:hypothetical protein